MFDLVWIVLIIGSGLMLTTSWLWTVIKPSWLYKTTFLLVLSLPFEYVPSLELGGVNIRLSQVLVLLGFYFLLILVVKREPEILNSKVNPFLFWALSFWVALLPSLFWVINAQRQIQVLIATALAFGATFLVANFIKNTIYTAKSLVLVMTGVGVFGLFQFAADFVGVPYSITLLREHYTKRVFGFARVHATALEPLYWGGMLLFPCVFLLVYFIFKKQTKIEPQTESTSTLSRFYSSRWLQLLAISVLYLNLILTLSRGAYLAFSFSLIIALFLCFRYISWKTISKWFIPYLAVILVFASIFLFSNDAGRLVTTATDHILNVFTDKQTSTVERLNFLTDALNLLYQNVITGIGSGNYGPRVQNNIPSGDGGWLIVNNVYVEIWLEQGLLAILVFLSMLGYYLRFAFKALNLNLKKHKNESNNSEILIFQISILAAICGYLIQWMTFSPIFIMPFFILFGLLIKSLEL